MTTSRRNSAGKKQRFVTVSLITMGVLAGGAAVTLFLTQWLDEPPLRTICVDHEGKFFTEASRAYFRACIKTDAETFLKVDFAESKDLAKAFLTLLTTVFVASITFSEKIVDVHSTGRWPRTIMISSWIFLLGAIITAGTGLAMMMLAAWYAAHKPMHEFLIFEGRGGYSFIASGILFGSGLIALLVAGVLSLLEKASTVAPVDMQ